MNISQGDYILVDSNSSHIIWKPIKVGVFPNLKITVAQKVPQN